MYNHKYLYEDMMLPFSNSNTYFFLKSSVSKGAISFAHSFSKQFGILSGPYSLNSLRFCNRSIKPFRVTEILESMACMLGSSGKLSEVYIATH